MEFIAGRSRGNVILWSHRQGITVPAAGNTVKRRYHAMAYFHRKKAFMDDSVGSVTTPVIIPTTHKRLNHNMYGYGRQFGSIKFLQNASAPATLPPNASIDFRQSLPGGGGGSHYRTKTAAEIIAADDEAAIKAFLDALPTLINPQ